jgi:hypothetical protein
MEILKSRRYKPDVIAHHNSHNECFKFVINNEEDEKELFEKYIDNGIVNPENVWLMPCVVVEMNIQLNQLW